MESIKGEAFAKCSGLTKIVIPSTVTNLGYNGDGRAFTQCESLKEIIVDEKNTIYDSRDECNALIKTDTNTLVLGTGNTKYEMKNILQNLKLKMEKNII